LEGEEGREEKRREEKKVSLRSEPNEVQGF
jgi:hypothetical protein